MFDILAKTTPEVLEAGIFILFWFALTWLGLKTRQGIWHLLAVMPMLYLAWEFRETLFIFISVIGVSMWQLYYAFFGGK